jgi:hypothetical protein
MKHSILISGILMLLMVQSACDVFGGEYLSQQAAVDAAWNALAPATSSGSRQAWRVTRSERITGKKVDDIYRNPEKYCAYGLPDSKEIEDDKEYWLVVFEPKPATPVPAPEKSSTAPPNMPEPMLREAGILLDAHSGELVSYKLMCVIY